MPKPAVNPTLTKIATVRFAPSEYERLQSAADERGISVSELIRRMSLGRVLPDPRAPQVDTECIVELRRIGVNLNQSVQVFHTWGRTDDEEKRTALIAWIGTMRGLVTALDDLARRLR